MEIALLLDSGTLSSRPVYRWISRPTGIFRMGEPNPQTASINKKSPSPHLCCHDRHIPLASAPLVDIFVCELQLVFEPGSASPSFDEGLFQVRFRRFDSASLAA